MPTSGFEAQTSDGLVYFRRLPWEKMTTWAIFLLLIYALRGFFGIIIVTFVLSYIATNVVRIICERAGSAGQKTWMRQLIVVLVFVLFVTGLIVIGSTLIPQILEQGRNLKNRVMALVTIPDSAQADRPAAPRDADPVPAGGRVPPVESEVADPPGAQGNADREGTVPEVIEPTENGGTARPGEGAVLDRVSGLEAVGALATSGDSGREPNGRTGESPEGHVSGSFKELVLYRLRTWIGEERYDRYFKDESFDLIIDETVSRATKQIPELTTLVGQSLQKGFTYSIHFLLSVIFSFFIVWDLPKLERTTIRIPPGRFRDFCREIVPSLLTFSSVMGRAFQAQTIIALCNTGLTFVGLTVLGIENRYFLSVVVFFCSYIPVLGVFISTVPMSIVALVQPSGGFGLMLWAIVMVIILHLIEGYILNPFIMGERFEMNPILVIVILLVGEHFFGIWGLLLGVPVTYYIFYYAVQGHEDPSIRDSGIWQSLYPEEGVEPSEPETVEA